MSEGDDVMKVKIILVAALLLVGMGFYANRNPQLLYSSVMALQKYQASLSEKTIKAGDTEWSYLEGGSGSVLLLIHGFNSNKETWINFAGNLTDSYRVIIPDVPGFGKSSYNKEGIYTIKKQAERMKEFLKALKVQRAHVAGNSMGGAIGARMVIMWPQDMLSLCLFDSAGVIPPEKSDLAKLLEKGDNPLVVKKTADYKRLIGFNFVKAPWIPDNVAKWMGDENKKRAKRNNLIFSHIKRDMIMIENDLVKIKRPSLVIWGNNDRIIHVSAAKVFHKKIKGSKLHILDNCGHMPQLEKSLETSKIYKKFIETNK